MADAVVAPAARPSFAEPNARSTSRAKTMTPSGSGPRAELYLKRKLKLSQIRMRKAIREQTGFINQNKLLSETSSLNFSVYKRKQINELAVEIEP